MGRLITAKGGSFATVDQVEARDRLTVVVQYEAAGCGAAVQYERWVVWGGAAWERGGILGCIRWGRGRFRFVSAVQDKEVVLERNHDYWADQAGQVRRLRARRGSSGYGLRWCRIRLRARWS